MRFAFANFVSLSVSTCKSVAALGYMFVCRHLICCDGAFRFSCHTESDTDLICCDGAFRLGRMSTHTIATNCGDEISHCFVHLETNDRCCVEPDASRIRNRKSVTESPFDKLRDTTLVMEPCVR